MTSNLKANQQRHDILDIVRGVALLGVLLANMQDFSFFNALTTEEKSNLPLAELNNIVLFMTSTFLEGKFYSLFSILFGIGFAVFINKENALWRYRRRMFFLSIFGGAHALLLWSGDILLLYALLGLSLPLFSRLKDKTIFILSIFLICSPLIMDSIRVSSNYAFDPGETLLSTALEKSVKPIGDESGFRAYADLMKKADYSSTVHTNIAGWYFRWAYLLESNRPLKVLGLFLLGLLIGRNNLFLNLQEKTQLLIKIRNGTLFIGLPSSLLMAYLDVYAQGMPHLVNTSLYLLSVVPMALAYLAIICLCFSHDNKHAILKLFAPFGRMALTCYLIQSLAAIIIFRGSGLSFALELGPALYITIGLLVFVLQVLFCHIWLKYFQFGPFEWLWRLLTYWKYLSIYRVINESTKKQINIQSR